MNENKIINGECIEVMKTIEDNSVDFILCDLPYGTTACKWDTIIPFDKLWEQYNRILKDNGAIVLTASQPFTTKLIASNINNFKYCWVWEKEQGTNFLNAKKQPLKVHEDICVFGKQKQTPVYYPVMTEGKSYCTTRSTITPVYGKQIDKVTTNNTGTRYPKSIQKFNRQTGLHPTQKPVELFEYLIKTYTKENDVVLDNCAGSMTTAIAAINTNRKYICIEQDATYFKQGEDRINNHLNQCQMK